MAIVKKQDRVSSGVRVSRLRLGSVVRFNWCFCFIRNCMAYSLPAAFSLTLDAG